MILGKFKHLAKHLKNQQLKISKQFYFRGGTMLAVSLNDKLSPNALQVKIRAYQKEISC